MLNKTSLLYYSDTELIKALEARGNVVATFRMSDLGYFYEAGYITEPEPELTAEEKETLFAMLGKDRYVADSLVEAVKTAHQEIIDDRANHSGITDDIKLQGRKDNEG